MTAEEKARELVDKFYDTMAYPEISLSGKRIVYNHAKQYALIACDTVIDFMIADDLKNKDAHWSNSPEMAEQYRIKSIISKL